ncbi:MAG: NTP pyrophosphohydrolase, partial [Lachnospiraceae bacterium]|nr:NTP pyrophosphohydrolase [Lachnospiraceae bacterium]
MALKMEYCMQCGTKLRPVYHETEECDIPYCDTCGDYRFPVFNTAVSMIVTNEDGSRILLIRQYGRPT